MSQKVMRISHYALDFSEFDLDEKHKLESPDTRVATKEDKKYVISYYRNSRLRNVFRIIEDRIMATHPAIQPITGYSFDEENIVIIEPFLENGSVEKLIKDQAKGKKIPNFETTRAIIIIGIAAGMAYLHQNGICNRKLTASHVLLDNEMHPKITKIALNSDFHLDVFEDNYVSPPIYTAPEILGQDDNFKLRSDVFSFSVILYELFRFTIPWLTEKRVSHFKIIKNIMEGKRPSTEEIPKIWADLIERCWKNDFYDRPHFIEIVDRLITKKDEYFNHPDINKDELDRYIDLVTRDLDLSRA